MGFVLPSGALIFVWTMVQICIIICTCMYVTYMYTLWYVCHSVLWVLISVKVRNLELMQPIINIVHFDFYNILLANCQCLPLQHHIWQDLVNVDFPHVLATLLHIIHESPYYCSRLTSVYTRMVNFIIVQIHSSYSTLWSAVRGIKHEEGVVERPNTALGFASCCIAGSRPRPLSALFHRHSTYKACSN